MLSIPGTDIAVAWGDPTDTNLPNWRKHPRSRAEEEDDDDSDHLSDSHEQLIANMIGFDPDELDDDDFDDESPTYVETAHLPGQITEPLEEDYYSQRADYAASEPDYQSDGELPPTPPATRPDDRQPLEHPQSTPKDNAANEPYYQIGEGLILTTYPSHIDLLEDIPSIRPGFTGVIIGKDKHKYHYINGKRVSGEELDQHQMRGSRVDKYEHPDNLTQEQADFHAWRLATRDAARAFREIEPRLRDKDGGFTVRPISGYEPDSGYSVSIFPNRSFMKSAIKLGLKDVVRYYLANKELLKQPNIYFGGWHDPQTDNVFLDLSVRADTEEEARQLALDHDQLAYFDFKHKRSVQVNANATSGQAALEQKNKPEVLHAKLYGGRTLDVYKNTAIDKIPNLMNSLPRIRGLVNGDDIYLWDEDEAQHDTIKQALGLRSGWRDHFYIEDNQIIGNRENEAITKLGKDLGIKVIESLEEPNGTESIPRGGEQPGQVSRFDRTVQGDDWPRPDPRGASRSAQDVRRGDEGLSLSQLAVLEAATNFAVTLFEAGSYAPSPSSKTPTLAAGKPKPPGFTGVVVGTDGHKYHYVNGERVSQHKHMAAVHSGVKSQTVRHTGKLRNRMTEADVIAAQFHQKALADYQAQSQAQETATHHAGLANRMVGALGNLAKKLAGIQTPPHIQAALPHVIAGLKGAAKAGAHQVSEEHSYLAAEVAKGFVVGAAHDVVGAVEVMSIHHYMHMAKKYGHIGAIAAVGAATAAFAAAASAHMFPGSPVMAAALTLGGAAAIHAVFSKSHEEKKPEKPAEPEQPQTDSQQKLDIPHVQGTLSGSDASKISASTARIKKAVKQGSKHALAHVAEEHSRLVAEVAGHFASESLKAAADGISMAAYSKFQHMKEKTGSVALALAAVGLSASAMALVGHELGEEAHGFMHAVPMLAGLAPYAIIGGLRHAIKSIHTANEAKQAQNEQRKKEHIERKAQELRSQKLKARKLKMQGSSSAESGEGPMF